MAGSINDPNPIDQNYLRQLQQQNQMLQEQQRNQDLLRGQRPEDYQYTSQLDPTTGMLKAPYVFDPTKSEAYSQLRTRAMSQGPSTWAQMMLGKQNLEQQQMRDEASQQQAGAQAGARSNLAMRGGLGGGARTRMASQGARDLLMAGQGIARQGSQQRFGILGQDEATKQQLLGQVADTELNTQKGNIAAALDEQRRSEAAKQDAYNKKMESWGAERQAQATEKSKGK